MRVNTIEAFDKYDKLSALVTPVVSGSHFIIGTMSNLLASANFVGANFACKWKEQVFAN